MAIQFGNIDRELADRQNVIKEDAARQYRGSRDMMQSVTDLGDTISREVKEYKANKRADQRLDYKFKRDEENAKVRDEQHNMNIMKTKLAANTEMLKRSQASYMMKKWPYGKMATHKRYEEEKQEWREADQTLSPLDKIYTFGSLYSEEALRAVQLHQRLMNSDKPLDEEAEAASLRKISRFQPVKVMEWATNNGLYDPKDYGDPTAQANADATNIINTHMPGTITDANDFVNRTKSGLTRYDPTSEGVDSGVQFTGLSGSGDGSQDGSKSIFNELLDGIEEVRQTGAEVPETTTGDGVVTETTDSGVQFKGDKKPGWLNYMSVLGRQKIKAYEDRDMTNKLILDRDPHETTNSEIYHNLRVLEGYSNGEMVDDNNKLIAAGSVDANGLVNKSPEQRDVVISVLGITDPAKKKEWESYLMSDNVNKTYGYVKPGAGTGPWQVEKQGLITSEQQQKRSLLKLNPDQVNKLQRWAYNKSLGEMDRNHPHLSGGKAYKEIPYLKHILGDMGFRHGSNFMVAGDPGRYPKFGNAVKELTEADNEKEQLAAWNKMDKELFSTGIYSKREEGKSGKETKRFRFLRDRMDRLKNWITKGQYKGGGLFGAQFKQKK